MNLTFVLLGLSVYVYVLASQVRSAIAIFEPAILNIGLLGLAPDWRLFAPTPFVADRHLLARTVDETRTDTSPWRLIWEAPRCRWHRMFWNPERRLAATVIQHENWLRRSLGREDSFNSNSALHAWCRATVCGRSVTGQNHRGYYQIAVLESSLVRSSPIAADGPRADVLRYRVMMSSGLLR